eukprot:3122626-Prymnesium_polylepis.1
MLAAMLNSMPGAEDSDAAAAAAQLAATADGAAAAASTVDTAPAAADNDDGGVGEIDVEEVLPILGCVEWPYEDGRGG